MAKIPLDQLFEPGAKCLAMTTNGKNKGTQCGGSVRTVDRIAATKMIIEYVKTTDEAVKNSKFNKIISELLVCGTHQKYNFLPSEALRLEYRKRFKEWAESVEHHEPLEEIIPSKSTDGSRIAASNELKKTYPTDGVLGTVYILTCLDPSDMVKIGYTKDPSKRRRTWAKCHSGAEIVFVEETYFPQRLEALIHGTLFDKRRNIPCQAPRCDSAYHNEWFLCSVEEAKEAIALCVDQIRSLIPSEPEPGQLQPPQLNKSHPSGEDTCILSDRMRKLSVAKY